MLAERLDDYNDETLLDLILGYLRCCSTESNSGFKLFRAQSLSNMHVDNKACTLCISSLVIFLLCVAKPGHTLVLVRILITI